jgi:CheY-like chemotaxis protein
MPKLGGAETYERLRALSPDVPILFVTGYGAEAAEGDMFHETPLHRPVLQKPFTRGMLGRKVRELLDRAK